MIIIPAIDILDGKVVRLKKGDFNKTTFYPVEPVELIKRYVDSGFNRIHLVDLSGAKNGSTDIYKLVKSIFRKVPGITIQFGGGIRSLRDAELLLDSGVKFLVTGSLSVLDKSEFEKILAFAGYENIIVAVDVQDHFLRIKGWTENTGITISSHISYCCAAGVNTFLCTDIRRDGMLSGPNLNLYNKIKKDHPGVQIIASGGVSRIEDIIKLKISGIFGVVAGKAILEDKIDLKELFQLAD
jgi:phosphoribosylformimino-5-aminoimidazole carboxamide ribotide isomerase